jgi:hypothetical protein
LEGFAEMTKAVERLRQREEELRGSVLTLEVENGNLLDLKHQLLRDVKSANREIGGFHIS